MFGAFYTGSGYYGVGPIGLLRVVFTNPDIDGTYVTKRNKSGDLIGSEILDGGLYIPDRTKTSPLQPDTILDGGIYIPNKIKDGRY